MLTLDHISSRCQIMQMIVALSKFLIPHLEHILEETSDITLAGEVVRYSIVLLRVSTCNSCMKSAFHLPLSVIQRRQHASLSSVFESLLLALPTAVSKAGTLLIIHTKYNYMQNYFFTLLHASPALRTINYRYNRAILEKSVTR